MQFVTGKFYDENNKIIKIVFRNAESGKSGVSYAPGHQIGPKSDVKAPHIDGVFAGAMLQAGVVWPISKSSK
ncbi:hypothetical protein [Undibacterium sp.]|uniref:hypothetical protein n=1 Tax=Undibacterium sp. TaxID=1914977 RepID=UPI00374DB785